MHAVPEVTFAQRRATALLVLIKALGSYIGVAAPTRLGLRTNVIGNAKIVRESRLDVEVCGSLTWEAAINSFSNVFLCASKNGSAGGDWCCGANSGSAEAAAGCCDTTLFNKESTGGFGVFFAPTYESSVSATNKSAPSATQNIPSSVPSNQTACSPGANSRPTIVHRFLNRSNSGMNL